jgi:putative membrane protein
MTGPGTDRKLHPLSLVFNFGARLKDAIFPIIVVYFASRSGNWEVIVPAIIGVLASLGALWSYFSYSYRYDDDDLVIRTGLFFRNERHIPYNRIQNIDAVQNVVHRFFNVAVVQVQTGAGAEPEATLSVLPLKDLAEMRERVLLERGTAAVAQATVATDGVTDTAVKPAPIRLLHIPPRELLLAGFIENRGMALIAAAMSLLWQVDGIEKMIGERIGLMAPEWSRRAAEAGVTANGTMIVFGVVTLFVIATVFVRILSTVWAVIRLHDFTLVRDGNDLRSEFGLFTRVTATIPVGRVQTISVHQRWLHRKLGRAAIRVTTAGGSGIPGVSEKRGDREWLAPIIRTQDLPALIREIDPTLELNGLEWTPAHPRASLRLMRISALWAIAIAGATAFAIGWWSLLVGALLGLRAVTRARGIASNLGCAIVGDRVFFRSGWLHRVVSVARFERIQSALCLQSYFDRRTGMATVGVDTAGLGSNKLAMPYLPQATALEIQGRLAEAAIRTPFTW